MAAKIKNTLVSDSTEGGIRRIDIKNKYADIHINYCKELNMVVMFKTFKLTGNTHQMQLTADELEFMHTLKIGEVA